MTADIPTLLEVLHDAKVKALKAKGMVEDTLYIDIHEVDRFAQWSQALGINIEGAGEYTVQKNGIQWLKDLRVIVTDIGDKSGDVVYIAPDFKSSIAWEYKSYMDFRSSVLDDSGNRLTRQLIGMNELYDMVRIALDETDTFLMTTHRFKKDGKMHKKVGGAGAAAKAHLEGVIETYRNYKCHVDRCDTTNAMLTFIKRYISRVRNEDINILVESPVVHKIAKEIQPFIVHGIIGLGLAKKLQGVFKHMRNLINVMGDFSPPYGDSRLSRTQYMIHHHRRLDQAYPDLGIHYKTVNRLFESLFGHGIIAIPFGDGVISKYNSGLLKGAKLASVEKWIETGEK